MVCPILIDAPTPSWGRRRRDAPAASARARRLPHLLVDGGDVPELTRAARSRARTPGGGACEGAIAVLGGVYASHVALRAVLEDARGRGALGSSASATSAASARTPGASFPSSTSSGSRRSRGTTTARWPTVSTTAAALHASRGQRLRATLVRLHERAHDGGGARPPRRARGDPLHARRPALAPLPRLAPAHQRVPLGVGHVGRVPRPDPARRRRRAGALRAHRDPLAAGAHRRRARGERGRGGAPRQRRTPRGLVCLLRAGLRCRVLRPGPLRPRSAGAEMEDEDLPAEFVETIRTGWWTTCLEILPAKERARGRF